MKNSGNALFLFTTVLACVTIGCGGYGDVSPRTYEVTKAFYSACNTRSDERLDKIKQILATEKQGNAMTSAELAWLQDMVDDASAGEWEIATGKARRLMADQVDF